MVSKKMIRAKSAKLPKSKERLRRAARRNRSRLKMGRRKTVTGATAPDHERTRLTRLLPRLCGASSGFCRVQMLPEWRCRPTPGP